ncbi:MAG: hypothetical protein K1000chlam2_01008 [Chlamydiae bacterium]|nr:hypothetical protein [Chlamydiota bacterium]
MLGDRKERSDPNPAPCYGKLLGSGSDRGLRPQELKAQQGDILTLLNMRTF